MFRNIYVPVDNSDYSNRAIDLAVELGRAFGSKLTGCHVYAARLHDYRFKQMEYTLPEEYKDEHELERQRKIHDSLIAMGLQLISDSYLDVMQAEGRGGRARRSTPRMMDGKHYKALIEDTQASDYDLVIMGALGMGAVKDSQLGSVTERFVRKVTARHAGRAQPSTPSRTQQGAIVVGLDGSPQSFHGLKLGIALGKALNRPVQAVAVYDPYLHYAMFNGIVGVLNEKASKIFRFKEQEQLHEEIIDTGLAKIYQSHLEIAPQAGGRRGRRPLDHAARRQVLREDADLRAQGAALAPDPGPRRRALRRARGRPRLQHGEPPAPGALQRAAHRRQVLPAARRQGRGDHLLDRGGRGAHGAGAAAGGRAWPAPRCCATPSSRATRSSPTR